MPANKLWTGSVWIFPLVAACSHSGTGMGDLQTPAAANGAEVTEGPVMFTWRSGSDPSKGKIEATLPDGRRCEGTFLQVTSTTATQVTSTTAIAPYYTAWTDPGWGAPGAWYLGPPSASAFVTQYSGKVIAHLRAETGEKMRCSFALKSPPSGMRGGAQGDCQLSTGETVFGALLREGKPKG